MDQVSQAYEKIIASVGSNKASPEHQIFQIKRLARKQEAAIF